MSSGRVVYISYVPQQDDILGLPDCMKDECTFAVTVGGEAHKAGVDGENGSGGTIKPYTEADCVEDSVLEWHRMHGTDINDFDKTAIAHMRELEGEGRCTDPLFWKKIAKVQAVDRAQRDIEDKIVEEKWDKKMVDDGRFVERGGKVLWLRGNGSVGNPVSAVSDTVIVDTGVMKTADAGPCTRVEVSLKTGDIVIELYKSTDIQGILEDLQKKHEFTDKMKKKLETLLLTNKP